MGWVATAGIITTMADEHPGRYFTEMHPINFSRHSQRTVGRSYDWIAICGLAAPLPATVLRLFNACPDALLNRSIILVTASQCAISIEAHIVPFAIAFSFVFRFAALHPALHHSFDPSSAI